MHDKFTSMLEPVAQRVNSVVRPFFIIPETDGWWRESFYCPLSEDSRRESARISSGESARFHTRSSSTYPRNRMPGLGKDGESPSPTDSPDPTRMVPS